MSLRKYGYKRFLKKLARGKRSAIDLRLQYRQNMDDAMESTYGKLLGS
jgi:hypothetical protein